MYISFCSDMYVYVRDICQSKIANSKQNTKDKKKERKMKIRSIPFFCFSLDYAKLYLK